mmetsp:Transcript_17452/g.34285  ORF Transcript_17452/g.34285 Transcript_17452/m.34285 type:complete len:193 (-) Transcript_17452:843-1421(-)
MEWAFTSSLRPRRLMKRQDILENFLNTAPSQEPSQMSEQTKKQPDSRTLLKQASKRTHQEEVLLSADVCAMATIAASSNLSCSVVSKNSLRGGGFWIRLSVTLGLRLLHHSLDVGRSVSRGNQMHLQASASTRQYHWEPRFHRKALSGEGGFGGLLVLGCSRSRQMPLLWCCLPKQSQSRNLNGPVLINADT